MTMQYGKHPPGTDVSSVCFLSYSGEKFGLAIGSACGFFLSVLRQAIWFLIYCMYFRLNDHENVSKIILFL
jgi:hypothetical protein